MLATLAAVLLAVLLCVPVSAVEYDPDASTALIVSVRGAELNESCSLSVILEARNVGSADAAEFTLAGGTITFGSSTFDISGCIKGKTVRSGAVKKYTVTVPARKVPAELSENDLAGCSYELSYTYKTGEYTHADSFRASAEPKGESTE